MRYSEGVVVGYELNGFTASLFSYNGMNEGAIPQTTTTTPSTASAPRWPTGYEQEDLGFNAGMAWVNNLADANAITDLLNGNGILAVRD